MSRAVADDDGMPRSYAAIRLERIARDKNRHCEPVDCFAGAECKSKRSNQDSGVAGLPPSFAMTGRAHLTHYASSGGTSAFDGNPIVT
jgi:hypothetical protein